MARPPQRGGRVGRGSRGSFRGPQRGRRLGQGPPKRNTFHANRLDEPVDAEAQGSDNEFQSFEESDQEDEASGGSSAEEGDAGDVQTSSYNNLLHSLSTKISRGEPQSKRRKLVDQINETNEISSFPSSLPPEEPELATVDDVDLFDDANSESDDVESDEDEDPRDPFESHFAAVSDALLGPAVKEAETSSWNNYKSTLGPGWKAVGSVVPSGLPGTASGSNSQVAHRPSNKWLKQRLQEKAAQSTANLDAPLLGLEARLSRYEDVLFCGRSVSNSSQLRSLMSLHALNHVLKTRGRVIKNNLRLAKLEGTEEIEMRDQGFTRPKVLFILPTRQACAKMVDSIVSFYGPDQQENRKRFQEAFSAPEGALSDDRPADFKDLFDGNDDDMFRIGMKFTRKTIKLFSQFYNSDIIFASPLGLRMAMGEEGSKKQEHDFLSSIEIVFVDHADALLMQNWEHVETIFDHLNLQPKEAHGCDFNRVRSWYLDGRAKYLRQTVITSSFNTPELNRLYSRNMLNIGGRSKIVPDTAKGAITEVAISCNQTFLRIEAATPVHDPDVRFNYFTSAILPIITKALRVNGTKGGGFLVFIPSYMDFVRVRNFLASSQAAQNISFGSISEYTPVPEIARARSHFLSGRHALLLYTGRAHHFRRYPIKGVRKVIMYGLPDNPLFYHEIVGGFVGRSLADGRASAAEASIRALFSKWDVLKLERVVGSSRLLTMLKEKGGDVFDFD